MHIPDYSGGGLVNLVAELEHRLRGDAPSPRLYPEIGRLIPEADSYVLVLFDGLGDLQLDHPEAGPFKRDRVAALDASFSTQTTVNTSTLATGLPPSRHGLISWLLRIGDTVLDTIYWIEDRERPSAIDPSTFLPVPNLAERLAPAGVEVVATEPAAFVGSPLDRVLYRGTTVVGVEEDREAVDAALDAVSQPGRLALVYLPHIDAAAHAAGQDSDLYAESMRHVVEVWKSLVGRLPSGAVAVGTADHGHIDVTEDHKVAVPAVDGLIYSGDNRVVYVTGDPDQARALAAHLPARWIPVSAETRIWGPPPFHSQFLDRLPDGFLVADAGYALVPPGTTDTMVGHHGGTTPAELRVPLLVAGTRYQVPGTGNEVAR